MKTYKIACIPGDGIGKEVVPAGQVVLEALAATLQRFSFDFTSFEWGGDYFRRHGVMMPEHGVDALRGQDAIRTSRTTLACGACASRSARGSTGTFNE